MKEMFPDRMLSLMKEKKITKKQISADLGIGINQIKYWEKNNNYPDADVIQRIADYLGTTASYLLELVDDPDPIALIDPSKKEPPVQDDSKEAALAVLGDLVEGLTEEQVAELRRYAEFLIEKNKK
ncbi:MAG: helix-turn-helix transcriptional regulator [Clostridia bacterium]|nr:helix-turn-helix transcriptional regulator [Clostridia bacterium]